jgi:hypothetical protein
MFLRVYRRERVTITFGPPFVLPKPSRLDGDATRDGTRLIMERIAALLPEENRGYYEGAPGDRQTAVPTEGAGE